MPSSRLCRLTAESLRSCSSGELLLGYFSLSIIITILTIVCEVVIVNISIKGTMVNEEERHGLTPFLSVHIVLGMLQLCCAVFGFSIFAGNSFVPCSALTTDSYLITALLLTLLVVQTFDVCMFTCCFGLVYQSERAEYRPDARRGTLISESIYSPSKLDLTVSPVDQNSFRDSLSRTCQSLCRCLQISSCNLFGGGNMSATNDIQTVANILTPLFHHEGFLDVVPSDVVAGIILVRLEQRGEGVARDSTASLSAYTSGRQQIAPTLEFSGMSTYKMKRFARQRAMDPLRAADFALMQEVSRFAKYALSMYTHLLYLYMKPCTGCCKLCAHSATRGCCGGAAPLADVTGDNCMRLHQIALTRFTKKLRCTCIYASFENCTVAKPFAVFVDVARRLVVVSIRGTLSLEDCITDLTAHFGVFSFEGADRCAHKGMLDSARFVLGKLQSLRLIERAAEHLSMQVNGYQSVATDTDRFSLVTTGHSLGAGTAVLLAFLLRDAYPQVQCFSFGTPASCVDEAAALASRSFVTSMVLGSDIVGRLSLRSLALLREQILDAISRAKVNKMEIIQSLFKEYHVQDLLYDKQAAPDTLFRRNLMVFNAKMEAEVAKLNPIPLFIPGRVVHFAKLRTVGKCYGKSSKYVPVYASSEEFEEIQVSPTMIWEHLPDRYVDEIDTILEEWTALQSQLVNAV